MLLQALPNYDPAIAEEFGYAVNQGASFLGVPLMESQNFLHLLIRFAFNLLISLIVVGCFYYRKKGRRDYMFTFVLFSSAMFLLIFLMENVKLQIGFTLGLFAIFGMIRYRTETVPVREMTYLFIIIALSVINGLSTTISYAELLFANAMVLLLIWICETIRSRRKTATRLVNYDRIALITPERRDELIADLQKRLGAKVEEVEIGHVDFLKDSAMIKVTYLLEKGENETIGNVTRVKDYVE